MIQMKYLTAKEAAEKRNITERRVQAMCKPRDTHIKNGTVKNYNQRHLYSIADITTA